MNLPDNEGVPVMQYEEREKLKEEYYQNPTKDPNALDYVLWMRFLSTLFNEDVSLEDRRYIKGRHPSFEEYRSWKKKFPGWSYDNMQPGHSAWKNEYWGMKFPMNEYYDLNDC